MIARLVAGEIRKLRGSLALVLMFVAPGLLGLLGFIVPFNMDRPLQWGEVLGLMTLPLWVSFVMPMAVAALAALFGQIEYRGRAWDHLLALPVARWKIYAAKAVVMAAMATLMTAFAFLFAAAGAFIAGTIVGLVPEGDFEVGKLMLIVLKIAASALFPVAILTWTALRFAAFVVPLAVGIGGALVSVAMLIMQTDRADWFPWVLPTLLGRYPNEDWYVWYGLAGGLAVFALMIVDLVRREMR
ncbi:ABC transporter permease [Novosphingopyxis sp.]|uniref:ABC transporter permease n=1 Tax=Novosphingopyxis sp. TaxID=2709690 RepID=UPI003B5AB89B